LSPQDYQPTTNK